MMRNKRDTNQLRIIGGAHRGRKLSFPDVDGLRPTPDRVRESVFNWLQGKVAGKKIVDLFAGAGGLGFEAASRGAHVRLVEKNVHAARSLRSHEALFEGKAVVTHGDALEVLPHLSNVDGVFVDPPYVMACQSEVMINLITQNVLNIGAWVYFEYPSSQTMPKLPVELELIKQKQAGQVVYCLAVLNS